MVITSGNLFPKIKHSFKTLAYPAMLAKLMKEEKSYTNCERRNHK